jgi:3-hydroxybutyryl-CoA dehydrogenase
MKVGLIGYGKMGRGIFSLLAAAPLEIAVDPNEMERQNHRFQKRLYRAAAGGTLGEAELRKRIAEIRFTTSWRDLRDCDLIIETVVEDYETKIEVLRRAEETVSPQCVVTTNTSSFSINRLAASLRDPSQFCGYHFFHPVQLTSIVEIITSKHTSPGAVDCLRDVSREIGRTPLVVKDRAGSCVNVPLTFMSCESLHVLEEGLALPSEIDAVVGRIARVGPCESLDVVGIPFFNDVFHRMLEDFPFDLPVPGLLEKLIRDGRLGKQVGRGLYLYVDDKPTDDAREYYVDAALARDPGAPPPDENRLSERLLFPVYFSVLKLAEMGLADLGDLCFGIQDLIGMKINPLEEMGKLGSDGLRAVFNRLRDELGPRFDCPKLEGLMATLE